MSERAGVRVLSRAQADRYLDSVCAILPLARLSREYPDVALLCNHLRALHGKTHRGLYDALEVDVETGLPTYKEWTRARADFSVAADALSKKQDLAELERRAAAEPSSIYGKQWLKHLYYSSLRGTALASLDQLKVTLRKIEDGWTRAQITLDRLDSQGLWRRCTMLVAQRSGEESLFSVADDDSLVPAEALHAALYRLTALDAELAFARFAVLPGVQVERVCTTTIGPLMYASLSPRGPLHNLLVPPHGIIAQFAIDLAARDLQADRDNDPLSEMLAGRLSEAARGEYATARSGHGYHVYKDRKFVVDAQTQRGLDEYCRRTGTRNVIYSVPAQGFE